MPRPREETSYHQDGRRPHASPSTSGRPDPTALKPPKQTFTVASARAYLGRDFSASSSTSSTPSTQSAPMSSASSRLTRSNSTLVPSDMAPPPAMSGYDSAYASQNLPSQVQVTMPSSPESSTGGPCATLFIPEFLELDWNKQKPKHGRNSHSCLDFRIVYPPLEGGWMKPCRIGIVNRAQSMRYFPFDRSAFRFDRNTLLAFKDPEPQVGHVYCWEAPGKTALRLDSKTERYYLQVELLSHLHLHSLSSMATLPTRLNAPYSNVAVLFARTAGGVQI